jgi:hypothetical protein
LEDKAVSALKQKTLKNCMDIMRGRINKEETKGKTIIKI